MKRPTLFRLSFCLVCVGMVLGCSTPQVTHAVDESPKAESPPAVADPYAPELMTLGTNPNHPAWRSYRFSDRQLAQMARTTLDEKRFVAYIEGLWPIERLRSYCVPKNTFPEGYQNLVLENCPFAVDVHKGKRHGFDRIHVYVSQDNGQSTYWESAGWNWHRWTYSLNVVSKSHHWCIIESLPNDFMDSPAFAPQSAHPGASPSPAPK